MAKIINQKEFLEISKTDNLLIIDFFAE